MGRCRPVYAPDGWLTGTIHAISARLPSIIARSRDGNGGAGGLMGLASGVHLDGIHHHVESGSVCTCCLLGPGDVSCCAKQWLSLLIAILNFFGFSHHSSTNFFFFFFLVSSSEQFIQLSLKVVGGRANLALCLYKAIDPIGQGPA